MLRRVSAIHLLAILVVTCTSLAVRPVGAQATVPALAAFEGRWEWNARDAERDRQIRAVDQVVDQLNVFMRELARGEIRRRLPPNRRVRFAIQSERLLQMWIDAWGPVQVPLDGSYRDQNGVGGERTRVSGSFTEGRIVEHQVTDEGRRTNTFMLDQNGTRLTMWVRVGSSQLPADIEYPLTYHRASE